MLRTDPTRYLSAAAYGDPHLTETILTDTLWTPDRLVAPCPGLDIGAVVRHCVRARRRHVGLQLLVAIQPLVWMLAAQLLVLQRVSLTLTAAGLIVILGLSILAYRLSQRDDEDAGRRRPRRQTRPVARHRTGQHAWWYVFAMLAMLALLSPLLTIALALTTTYLTTALLLAIDRGIVRYRLGRRLIHGTEPWPSGHEPGGALRRRLEEIQDSEAGNVTVYPATAPAKDDAPMSRLDPHDDGSFVDCGTSHGYPGTFRLPVDRPADTDEPISEFTAAELVDAVRDALTAASLAGGQVQDRVYVADETFEFDATWRQPEDGRSRFRVDGERLAEVIQHPQPYTRHHLVLRVADPDWKNQLIYTMAVHIHLEQPNLVIHTDQFVFAPFRPEFLEMGRHPSRPLAVDLAAMLAGSLLKAPQTVATAPRIMVVEAWHTAVAWLAWCRHDHIARHAPRPRQQTAFSVRGEVSQAALRDNALADVIRYQKVVEAALFAAIDDFLGARNISTAKFDEQIQQYTVINNGVIANALNASAVAAGKHATAQASTPPPAGPAPDQSPPNA